MTVVDVAPLYSSTDEGNQASFTITLSQPQTSDVTVRYRTNAGTATGSVDYTPVGEPYWNSSGSVVISAGTTSATTLISTIEDSLDEADETFSLTLESAYDASSTSFSIGTSAATMTILDDDTSGGGISVSVNDVSVNEGGSAAFKISLSSVSTQDVSVSYGTSNGTAGSSDYSATWSYAVIPAGSISTTGQHR